MQTLENNTLQVFLNRLIEVIKMEKELGEFKNDQLDIPFIISSLYQSFEKHIDIFKEFIQDLCLYPDYNVSILDSQNDYDGLIDVDIHLVKYSDTYTEDNQWTESDKPNYDYKLCFTYDTRHYGYCECTPDMPDYRQDKQCCGHGCDAVFCEFSLHKIVHIADGSWAGDEHDYWDFEDEFYMNDKELAERKEKEEREREIKELKNRIEADQKRLAELEGVNEIN